MCDLGVFIKEEQLGMNGNLRHHVLYLTHFNTLVSMWLKKEMMVGETTISFIHEYRRERRDRTSIQTMYSRYFILPFSSGSLNFSFPKQYMPPYHWVELSQDNLFGSFGNVFASCIEEARAGGARQLDGYCLAFSAGHMENVSCMHDGLTATHKVNK